MRGMNLHTLYSWLHCEPIQKLRVQGLRKSPTFYILRIYSGYKSLLLGKLSVDRTMNSNNPELDFTESYVFRNIKLSELNYF